MDHQQADDAHNAGAERGEHILFDMECQIEQHHADHENEVRQRGGQRPVNDVRQKPAADAVLVRLHGKDERRDADGQRVDQTQLRGRIRIGERKEQRDEGKHERENILDEIQRRAALNIVDDAPALGHDGRQRGKLRIKQHDMRCLTRDARAGGHGDGAVCLAQRQHVVHAVAGHGDGVARPLHGCDELLFLIRRDASEDGHVLRRPCKLRVCLERPRIDEFLRIRDPGTPRDLRNSQGIVAGNDLRAHALLRKIGERLRRFGPDLVAQQDQRQRHHFRVQRFVRQLPVVKRQQQHAAALRRPFLRQRQILLLFRAVRQQNFRCTEQIRLVLVE